MAKTRKERGLRDKGRGFYETSSPFETYEPGAKSKPKTWAGYHDEVPADVAPHRASAAGGAATDLAGPEAKEILTRAQPEQYDNPRGYPGLSIVTAGDQRSKLPHNSKHSIMHSMEGSAELARTGKGNQK